MMVVEFIKDHLPDRWGRFLSNRVLTDVLIVLVVILGFLVIDVQGNLKSTQDCVRDFLVQQGKAQGPRNEVNQETDEALADAVNTIPPLLQNILDNNEKGGVLTPEDRRKSLEIVIASNNAFNQFKSLSEKLAKTRENFPLTPAPEDLCKE